MSEIREVVIIGSGPAGYTAALYAARARMKPLLFGSSIFVGGSLTTTTEVENFPGFPKGVDGPVLMENMRAQAEKFGAEMIDDDVEEATFLTRFAKSVTVVHRRSTLRASKVMQDRAFADDKISFAFDAEIAEIKETGGMLSGVVLRDVFTGATHDLDLTGLFIAIGHDPRTELFAGQLDLDAEGYSTVAAPTTRTSLPGVFAAGDVVDHTYRQAITAAGTGAAAALDAERYFAALTDTSQAVEPDKTPAVA
ncbi:NAD(P)/FAD-dependent oxidoreductase [Streptomyces sp. NPDC092903]|uniref:NAD(P)/FAD-dependent oxidoreductase n=1 Tax=Streptomyces sp. NPDC092903 TaxID=3366017 RepID=UPI0037F9014E